MTLLARSFFTALLLFGLGCAHLDLSRLPTPSGADLLKDVDELEGLVSQVKGTGRVQVKSDRGSGEVSAFIAARAPGDVHLELLDFFGSPVQVLVSDGRSFGLYQRDKATYLHGPATASAISRVLPLDVSGEDLVAILLGRTPRLHGTPSAVVVDQDAEAYRLSLQEGERLQTLWIHPSSKRVLKSVLTGKGGYTLTFERPVSTGGVPFARKVTFTDANATVVLRWSDEEVTLEGRLDAALFTPAPPPGVRTVEVEALAPGAG
jgi:outer membrane lipoprotein-sorting protein